jgi:HPt (histidine-containing phosphotransfer) domain-containing protein
VLLDLTEDEKGALLDLLVAGIERGEPSRRTDLLHRVLAKLGTDTIAEPLDPLSPLDETVLEALRELQRDRTPNLLGMLVSLFRENVPGILKELAVAAEGTDPERLLTLAHKLRGISMNVGARLFAARCKELESATRLGSVPANAMAEVQALAQEYVRAEAALNSWIGTPMPDRAE